MLKNTSTLQNPAIPKKPKALTDWTYEYLKEQILDLVIQPGEQIHIEEFTEKLGVSRTPVREAFLRLASEGLVEIQPRVGYYVTDVTEQDIRDLFEAREIIEARAAAKAACSITDAESDTLKKVIKESKIAVAAGDYDTYLSYDTVLHNFLQSHMNNKRLDSFMQSLNNLTYRERKISIKFLDNINKTVIEHEKIVEALVKHDSEEAAWYTAEHLKKVSDRLLEYMKSNKNSKGER